MGIFAGEVDINTLIQLLTGSVGGLAGGWLMAFIFYRDKNATQNQLLNSQADLIAALNNRIAALEKATAECDSRYTLLLQHVLSTKRD